MVRVSVIVPTRERVDLLRGAVDSVLAQSYRDFELIVVDDGSTDGTEAYCRERGDRLRYLRQESAGAAAARNRGASEAGGEWLAFLDSDDTWTPDSLKRRMARADAAPDADLVYADARVAIDGRDDSRLVSERRKPYEGSVTEALAQENFLCTSTVLLKKSAFDRAGGFRTAFEPAEDYDLWLRVSVDTQFAYEPAPLVVYRVHAGSIGTDRARMFAAEIRVLEDFSRVRRFGDPVAVRHRLARLCYFLGVLELEIDPALARKHFLAAARRRPPGGRALAFAAASVWPRLVVGSTRRFLARLELY